MLLLQVLIVRSISCGDVLISRLRLMTGRALRVAQRKEVIIKISGNLIHLEMRAWNITYRLQLCLIKSRQPRLDKSYHPSPCSPPENIQIVWCCGLFLKGSVMEQKWIQTQSPKIKFHRVRLLTDCICMRVLINNKEMLPLCGQGKAPA